MDLSRRAQGDELMDSGDLPREELAAALAFLARANRWLGGAAVVVGLFERWSRSWAPGETVTVLDVGAGTADIPLALVAWGRARGFDVRVTAIDSTPAVARIAQAATAAEHKIQVFEADLFDFVQSGRRHDYVIASLLLHHVPEKRQAEALRALAASARRGLAVIDLERSRPAYWGVKLLTGLFGDRVTRHDGPLSVRKGFRASELAALAREAGLPHLAARRHPFFRLSLSGEKVPVHA